MQLWQLDLVGGILLADGMECKMVTGIDDHSRFIVIAAVVVVPTGRAVVETFTAAMRRYGVPSEVLSNNGKQFTGRFTRPFPAEVLFERVCRENGICQRLTKRRSPTTTGKIERWHKTLREELLDQVGAFPSGHHVKTVGSRLNDNHLRYLMQRGARPVGRAPAAPALPPPSFRGRCGRRPTRSPRDRRRPARARSWPPPRLKWPLAGQTHPTRRRRLHRGAEVVCPR